MTFKTPPTDEEDKTWIKDKTDGEDKTSKKDNLFILFIYFIFFAAGLTRIDPIAASHGLELERIGKGNPHPRAPGRIRSLGFRARVKIQK